MSERRSHVSFIDPVTGKRGGKWISEEEAKEISRNKSPNAIRLRPGPQGWKPEEKKAKRYPEASITSHAVTGGLEGAVGIYAVEPALERIRHGGTIKQRVLQTLQDSPKGHLRKIAIGATAGALATAPIGLLVEEIRKARADRKRKQENLMSATIESLIELGKKDDDFPRAKKQHQPYLQAAGVAAVAAGASTFPAARRLIGIKVRQVGAKNLGIQEASRNQGGKAVADYIEAAQLGLNSGLKGRAAGKVIQHVMAHPEGKVAGAFKKVPGQYGSADIGQRLASEHFAKFRASPKSALDFWDYEQGLITENTIKKQTEAAAARGVPLSERLTRSHKRAQDELHYGREETNRLIQEQMQTHGKSEMEAIKNVAYKSNDPQVQGYFNRLAMTKSKAVDQYAKKALISPALIGGGTAAIVYGRKKNQRPHQAIASTARTVAFNEILADLVEFETTQRNLKSGVRLDKYEKTIRGREIDRHLHDYLRSAGLGAVAGVAIPGAIRARNRALIGAGVGTAVQGALHAGGAKDEYGEQSEEAKVLQRNATKYIAGAAVVGGLIGRYRKKRHDVLAALEKMGKR